MSNTYSFLKRIIRLDIPLQYIFLCLGLIEALIMASLVPMYQAPDELHHYNIIMDELGLEDHSVDIERFFNNTGTTEMLGNYDVKVDHDKYFDFNTRFSDRVSVNELSPTIMLIRHFPSAVGLVAGMLLNLPIFFCLFLAELFSLLFYLFMGFLCIKVTPIKKEVFLFILLMPMTLQQCSSVNYDNVVICCALLFVAYLLALIYEKKEVKWRNLGLLFVLLGLVCLTKPPYIVMGLSLLLIPLEKYKLKLYKISINGISKKAFGCFLVALSVFVVGALYVCRNIYMIKLIIAMLLSPLQLFRLFVNSWGDFNDLYIRSLVGQFGGLDSPVNTLFVITFFIILVFMNSYSDNKYDISLKNRIGFLSIGIISIVMIFISLIGWTYRMYNYPTETTIEVMMNSNKELNNIVGVQGRYFIPVLPFLIIPFSGTQKKNNGYKVIMSIYYLFSFVYVISVLNSRYWS